MTEWHKGGVIPAGGTLTRESLLDAAHAIRDDTAIRPNVILTSMATIRSGRRGAMQAEATASWSEIELAQLPRWRFLRRHLLRCKLGRAAANAQALRGTFGYGQWW